MIMIARQKITSAVIHTEIPSYQANTSLVRFQWNHRRRHVGRSSSHRHTSSDTIIWAQRFFHHLLFSPTYTRMKKVAAKNTACAPDWMKSSSGTVGTLAAMRYGPSPRLVEEAIHHLLESVTLTYMLGPISQLLEVLLHRTHQADFCSCSS